MVIKHLEDDDDDDFFSDDGQNSTDDESNAGSKPGGSGDDQKDENGEKLAHRESRNVFRLRVIVIIVLLLAATAVSVVVYLITTNAEYDEFQTQFGGSKWCKKSTLKQIYFSLTVLSVFYSGGTGFGCLREHCKAKDWSHQCPSRGKHCPLH